MFNSLSDLEKVQKRFLGIYRGIVINNVDPRSALRVQVKVYPMMTGFNNADLPWAKPCFPVVTGSESGAGWQVVPENNSYLWIAFEEGDIRKPVYLGEAFSSHFAHSEMDSVKKKVMKFKSGLVVSINDDAADCWVKILHPTGSYSLIDKNGNIELNPNSSHRSIINAFSRTVETKLGGSLNGDDGGLILFTGAVTFVLPNAADYEGLEYVFKRLDAGLTPAIVGATIEPNPYNYREITGLYATLHLISGGNVTDLWHVI